ncbi:MAG: response regulator [Williamsia sp.]|nr:response regulator [Williamsia sp.]
MLTTKDGLPQSFVSGMVQDKQGFVWIGTRNGLARYDGRHFKVFQHKEGDTSTLQSNVITAMKMDAHNRIWIRCGEYRSIDCFDPVTEQIEHITERPLFRSNKTNFAYGAWLPTTAGNLWCIPYAEGAVLYDWKQNRMRRFSSKTGHLSNDTVCEILEGRNKVIWMLARRGLASYNPATDRVQNFPYPDMVSYPQAFIECRNGELMFAVQDRLVLFNPTTATFRTVASKEIDGQLSLVQGPDGYYFLSHHFVHRFDGGCSIVPVINMSDYAIPGILSLLVDRSGLIWLSVNTAGICQIDPYAPGFSVHTSVSSFHYDLLKQEFGTAMSSFDSLCRCGPPRGSLNSYELRWAYDAQHKLFIAYDNNVWFFDPQQQRWSALPALPISSQSGANSPSRNAQSLCFDPDGRLWAFNYNKFIGYFDTSSRQWIAFVADTLKDLQSIITLDISADRNDVWISGGTGLVRINRATKKIDRFSKSTNTGILPIEDLLGLQQDPSRPDLLWIGSFEGLICLHKSTLQAEVFTTAQGLPDNTIYSIQTDSQGYLWLSTNQGLCRFHPLTHETRNFSAEDGLPGNEFNRFHHFKLPDGRLAYGGVDGWVTFNPNTIVPDSYQPQVAFTGLKIYNEPVPYSPSSKLLPRPLNAIRELVLPFDQNTLTFDFAGLEYNQPDKLRYRYRLEAYDDKWIETDNPVASYTRLVPGHYTLLVNCTNSIGKWSGHIRKLPVTVLPPWWRTWWAYLCYVLILAGALWVLYRNWLQREKARQLILLQQKEAEQLKAVDEMKNRFFSNITHEFRTPLSLIIAPLDQLQQNEQPPANWNASLGKIQRNAVQLLRLINQLLDISKLEAGNMKTTLFRGNPQSFVQDVVESFWAAALPKNIALCFDADKLVTTEYLFDADKLHTILSNLLSNAVKFTPQGGRVDFTLVHEEESPEKTVFSFRVQDSGIGIAPDKLPFVFHRFYQVDDSSTRNYGGTGIGLALAKEMAELMKGSLHAESEPGQGSTFTLRLPLVKAVGTDVPAYTPFVKPAVVEPPAALAIRGAETEPDKDNRPCILIAEDNPELNEFLAQSFRPFYRVLTAVDGVASWQLAQQELPDVIISDWMMPDMDGQAFCQAVKGSQLTGHIAFVMLTAKAAPNSRLQALQSQADDYLAKPFSLEELKLRVANLLERQRRLREKLFRELSEPHLANNQLNNQVVPAEDPFISKIHAIIEDHLDESAFGVEELAAGLYMSRANLHRKAKTIADLTPTLLIRNYRLKRSAQFLKEGAASSEAAYKSGFDSAAYFSKCFREFYHCTPGEFVQSVH